MNVLIIIFAFLLLLIEVIRIYFLSNYGNTKTILRMLVSAWVFTVTMPLTFKLLAYPQGFFFGAIIVLIYPYCAIETKIPKDENSNAYILRKKWLHTYPIVIFLYAIATTVAYLL